MEQHWSKSAIFYHIYPLGLCGAPYVNDYHCEKSNSLEKLFDWVEHLNSLGFNALYLGPVFESSSHGYDTKDFFQVDKRLGDNATLSSLVQACHHKGIKVIFDGVFHHVGRDFHAFKDLQEKREASAFVDWFVNIDFSRNSPYEDHFYYEGWRGHYSLVKLNLQNPQVKELLFKAVKFWIERFAIDGLRLDAADCIDFSFLKELSGFCKSLRPDFWLLGEVVHGDYRQWANAGLLDSVTNYEFYKGLYSGHNDKNYFEIMHSLARQFGGNGLYKNLPLYNFADNHDIDRISSILRNQTNLYPLYCILFTMPGIPSVYYGSEWGIYGKKQHGHDHDLRPCIDLTTIGPKAPHPDLITTIKKLIAIRNKHKSLKSGKYQQLHISSRQLAFLRSSDEEAIIVAVNSDEKQVPVQFSIPHKFNNLRLIDLLNEGDSFDAIDGKLEFFLHPNWARILIIR
jgi:cyclomaltodextrinase / maltogenic alpha-amylase / neopullulanase